MSIKLELNEAQRNAMIEEIWGALDFQSMSKVEVAVDRAIAAANRIPEGPPVGTIARRPDGAWKAERKLGPEGSPSYWMYSKAAFWESDSPSPDTKDADSWPVIYDPTAQQEPATPNQLLTEQELGGKPPRSPRVVDRLGVDERDAEWTRTEVCRDTFTWEYRFKGAVWRYRLLGHQRWTLMQFGEEPSNGPFTEVTE
ncbi:hypothetical protein PROPHIGD54-2_131 [Mycobacterium phage prophiGD54-2]|nr:hypothetical protein PROPHIGD54-2_131 [Mycobacterium phage prophiGD54-2]